MKEWKVQVNKDFLRKHMGSISQLGGIKKYEFNEGRAKGVDAIDFTTGSGLDFTVLPGRCMDLAWAHYKGVPIAYMSKADIAAPNYLEQEGMEWLRSFYAGMLTTCGFGNVGGPCEVERRIFGMQKHGLHGRLANLPASEFGSKCEWINGEYVMKVEGKMRQSAVHGENITLRRTIIAKLGEKKFHIHDVIENEGLIAEPIMLLYHMNFGYPLLDKYSRLIVSANGTKAKDAAADAEMDVYASFHEPIHLCDERCYFHDVKLDGQGNARVAIINDELELGAVITYSGKTLPCLTEWKMLSEGEYVLGLEPCNTNPVGRPAAQESGALEYLEPGMTKEVDIELEILDGSAEIAAMEKIIKNT